MSWLIDSPTFDPHYNLALEEVLLSRAEETPVLYLWQNAHTVVIGKNQNPWKECRTTLLEQEGGRLARRLSGGGAVYHDLGNLNFTILLPREQFDLPKQMEVIRAAVEAVGVEATVSGRNDVLAEGRKFSGNAFYKGEKAAYHHGTLLIHADMEKLGRYLSPDRKKLQSKGVASVSSRVVNLTELVPDLTVAGMKQALVRTFEDVYGPVSPLELTETEQAWVELLTERNRNWRWVYGKKLPFDVTWEDRFPWGGIEINLRVTEGRVAEAKVYTDAMDESLADQIEKALFDCLFTTAQLSAAMADLPYGADLRQLVEKQEL